MTSGFVETAPQSRKGVQLVTGELKKVQELFPGLAKPAEGALHHLTEVSKRGKLLKGEGSPVKSQLSDISKASDEAVCAAEKRSRQARALESHIGLLQKAFDLLK